MGAENIYALFLSRIFNPRFKLKLKLKKQVNKDELRFSDKSFYLKQKQAYYWPGFFGARLILLIIN